MSDDTRLDVEGLSEAERKLVRAVAAGEGVPLGDDSVRAEVLACLIAGRSFEGKTIWPVQPHFGVQMHGGQVTGRLNLEFARIDFPVALDTMKIPAGVALNAAETRLFRLDQCTLGSVSLMYAEIRGQFMANQAGFEVKEGTALNAQGATITDGMFMDGAEFQGTCDINSAQIGGQFSANQARFEGKGGDALNAQGAEITHGMFLREAKFQGTCDINSAQIGYQFSANQARFEVKEGTALNAQGAGIADGMFLSEAEFKGTCDINSAQIGGQVAASKARFEVKEGTALNAQRAVIKAGVFFRGDVDIKGDVDFAAAQITGGMYFQGVDHVGQIRASHHAKIDLLDLSGAKLKSVYADRLDQGEVDKAQNIFCLDLEDARIGRLNWPEYDPPRGICDLTRCQIEVFCDSKAGWISAPGQTNLGRRHNEIEQRRAEPWLFFYESDEERAVRIKALKAEKALNKSRKRMPWECARLEGLIYQYLTFPGGDEKAAPPEAVADARERWLLGQHEDDVTKHFKPQPWRQLAKVLRSQGYDEAARQIYIKMRRHMRRSAGIKRRTDKHKGFSKFYRWGLDQGRLIVSCGLDWTAGYGHKPWRAFWISLAVIAVCTIPYFGTAWSGPMPGAGFAPFGVASASPVSDDLAVPEPVFVQALAGEFSYENMREADWPDAPGGSEFLDRVYPQFNPFWYSLDVFIPVLDLGMEKYWRANTNHPQGWWLYLLTLFQRLLGAILIAIMVTSFTGLLTRDENPD